MDQRGLVGGRGRGGIDEMVVIVRVAGKFKGNDGWAWGRGRGWARSWVRSGRRERVVGAGSSDGVFPLEKPITFDQQKVDAGCERDGQGRPQAAIAPRVVLRRDLIVSAIEHPEMGV
jgi:hypothetical protein